MQIPTGKSMSLSTLNSKSQALHPEGHINTTTKEVTMRTIQISEGVTFQPYRPTAPAANWAPSYSPLFEAESILFDRNLDRENRMNIVQYIAVDLKHEVGEVLSAAKLFGKHGYEKEVTVQSSKRQGKHIKKIRRELNSWFRKDMSIFKAKVRAEKAVKEAQKKEENRAFTQHHQWEALCDIMQEAYDRKVARQAKHKARIEKMKAKKVNGVTPKQVKKSKKKVIKVVQAKVTYVQLSKREKQDIEMGLEWARYQRINNRKAKKEEFAMSFKEFKRDHNIRLQGARLRALVSGLINKEVK